MGLFGLLVLASAFLHVIRGTVPVAETMGAVGVTALTANAASFALLWAYRGGDSNMRSVWLCSRNDVLGNLAVLLAALGVFRTGFGWTGCERGHLHGQPCLAGCICCDPSRPHRVEGAESVNSMWLSGGKRCR
jgi:hypothetical protein